MGKSIPGCPEAAAGLLAFFLAFVFFPGFLFLPFLFFLFGLVLLPALFFHLFLFALAQVLGPPNLDHFAFCLAIQVCPPIDGQDQMGEDGR